MQKYIEVTDNRNNFIQVFSNFKNDKVNFTTFHKEGAKLDSNILDFIASLISQLYGKNDTQKVNNESLPNFYSDKPILRGKKRVLEYKEKDLKTGTIFKLGYQFTNK